MRLDQAVGAQAADEEGARTAPRTAARAAARAVPRAAPQQRHEAGAGRRRRRHRALAVGRQTEIGRPVAHQRERQHGRQHQQAADENQRHAPAEALGQRWRAAAGTPAGRWPSSRSEGRRPGRGAAENQRVATVAPSTSAVSPVPTPTTMPHSSDELPDLRHGQRARRARPRSSARAAAEHHAAQAEAVHERRRERAHQPEQQRGGAPAPIEICALSQPNSRCSGTIITPGAPTAPAVASMVRKVTATTTQP